MRLKGGMFALVASLVWAVMPATAVPDPYQQVESMIPFPICQLFQGPLTPRGLCWVSNSPIEEVGIESRSSVPISSVNSLIAGVPYELVAKGTVSLGGPIRGDAECTALSIELGSSWSDNRYEYLEPGADPGDLYVNGQKVKWRPTRGLDDAGVSGGLIASRCDANSHVYSYVFTPSVTGPVNFVLHETSPAGYGDNTGFLYVNIRPFSRRFPGARLIQTVTVSSTSPSGTQTASLQTGQNYILVASGTYIFDNRNANNLADAECSDTATSPPGRNRYGRTIPINDPLDLSVNDRFIDWTPQGVGPETSPSCSPSNVYSYSVQAISNNPVTLRISDFYYADNAGSLTVDLYIVDGEAPQ